MFAGIIEAKGHVIAVRPARSADGQATARLAIDLGKLAEGLQPGASVAVNGACLTLAASTGTHGEFDVVPETWRLTNLAELRADDAVNLERSLRVGDRIDGHFVQGHIDGVGTVAQIDRGGEWKLWISPPAELRPYIVRKGSIALDGTSLTIADVTPQRFSVALIPTTLARTTLGERRLGQRVNLETDLIARLIVSRLDALAAGDAGGITWERLAAAGWVAS